MNKPSVLLGTFTGLLLTLILASGCKQGKTIKPFDEAFAPYISAYTTGTISRQNPVIVRLNEDVGGAVAGAEAPDNLFTFKPAIQGHALWVDTRSVGFYPDEYLPSGQFYEASFALGEVLEVSGKLGTFNFQFETQKQAFSVYMEGVKTTTVNGTSNVTVHGLLTTADVEATSTLSPTIKAKQGGKALKVIWEPTTNGRTHNFKIEDVARGEKASKVEVEWTGDPLDIDFEGSTTVDIPAIGEFIVTNVRVRGEPDPFIEVEFSDPIQTDQDLRGLISVSTIDDLSYIIRDNTVEAHFWRESTGDYVVSVLPGILNISGKKLTKKSTFDITLEDMKPAVRLVGTGVIIPKTDGLVFPFEAVNLNAVDVTIIKIYEDNVLQFLQVNDLEGDYQLRRVGEPVKKKTIALNEGGPVLPNKWHRYGIKLDELIDADPGAIYRVSIGFRKVNSLYACGEDADNTEQALASIEDNWDEMEEDEASYWDFYEDFYEDWNYDWSNRDNPCHDAYYNQDRYVSRNVIASDLGLVAKLGDDNQLRVYATDLLSAKAVSGVQVEVFDYQQQSMGKLTTDSEGGVSFKLSKKPFAVVAERAKLKGYLKLIDGNSLSLGRFDVSGVQSKDGVKGMLYGERGVWRPGDTLHLTFVLEDRKASLPTTHPVAFELYDPRGQLVEKKMRTTSVNGLYDFTTVTSSEAPTGDYLAKVTVGGSTFTKTLKIETVKPNRLKINIDFGKEELAAADEDVKGKVDVKWLHGAVAKGLRTVVEMNLTPTRTAFPNYSEYVFDDPSKTFYSDNFTVFDGNVNDEGQAAFTLDVSANETAPGKLNAIIKTRAFEKGGDFSVDVMTIPYHPFTSYAGIKPPKGDRARGMLLTDTNHVVDIVTVTTDGKPVSRPQVAMELFKLDWEWWWESSGNLASYLSREYVEPMKTDTIKTTNGKGKWTLRIDYPEWGRYIVRATDLTSGHSTGQVFYMDWPGWAGRGKREMGEGAAMLTFNADKDKYNVGDQVSLMIPTSEGGQALVSIETGSGVIKTLWADTRKEETKVTFTATAEMAPNVYAHVTLLQPHAQTVNDLPIRLYGVIPVMVEDPKTHLEPVITTADVYRPDQKVSITVSEKNGREMAYTLAVVDEGLLDLTRFKTPDLWQNFYAKEALGVKTWDLYEQVLGAQGGELERLLAIGGDGESGPPENAQANRFKPVVQFFGPLQLDAGEKKTHTFTMPQYIGSVKVMLVAADNGSYGKADKAVPVRKPLMVLATMPRVIGPSETVKLPVTVFAMEPHVKNVSIQVTASDNIIIHGSTTKTLQFDKPGEETIDFDLEVKEGVGIGKVTVKGMSGSEKAQDDIEITIRNPNPVVTNVTAEVVDAGKSWSTSYTPPGVAGTNKGTLEVSVIPPLNLGKRLDYLIMYPHGCIEQTTSSVFPQLLVRDLIDVSKAQKDRMEGNVKAGIKRLLTFQQPNGGLSYWPGSSGNADDWSTSYAGHFMIEAKGRGYSVPDAFMKKWKAYQKKLANEWTAGAKYGDYGHSTEMIQAYRLYTLALAGAPEMGAMNRLREVKDLAVAAHWRLAAAYALAGQQTIASNMVKDLPTSVPQYKDYAWTYGSAERDQAMILETLTLLKNRTLGMTLVKSLSDALCEPRWFSTQTTAYSLLAIAKFTGDVKEGRSMNLQYRFGNGQWQTVQATSAIKQVEIPIKGNEGGQVELKNQGTTVVYARVTLSGQPAIGDQVAYESNLKMKVEYKTIDGRGMNPKAIEQGTDFVAEVTITHPGLLGTYDNMALSQIFASGWEITNARLDGFSTTTPGTVPEYQDIRDDRVYTYFDLTRTYSHTYKLVLNASYVGRYYLPTVYCEAMYDASINARQPGMWVEVLPVGAYAMAKHGQPY